MNELFYKNKKNIYEELSDDRSIGYYNIQEGEIIETCNNNNCSCRTLDVFYTPEKRSQECEKNAPGVL